MKHPAHVSVTQNIYFSVFCACRIERKSRSSLTWPQFLSFSSFNWQREVNLVWLQLLSQPPRAEGTLTTPAWEGIVGCWGPATLESQGGFSYPKKLRLAYLPNNSFGILFIFFFFFCDCAKNHTTFCSILSLAWWHWLAAGHAGSSHVFGCTCCLKLFLHAMKTHYWELLETQLSSSDGLFLACLSFCHLQGQDHLPICSLK